MNVKLLDLVKQYQTIKDEVEPEIKRICETQYLILGPNVKALEAEIAAYSEAKFGIAVASGTDALILGLKAVGVGQGDKVLTSPFTFFCKRRFHSFGRRNTGFCRHRPAHLQHKPRRNRGRA